jgi:type 1 glutamine amidotransferase
MSKISTLLVTGANNHDWSRSAPFCRELLETSGKFAVTLTEDPSASLGDAEALEGYDLIFSDYNGPDWSDAAKANFEAAVRGGTGLVILHAADNAFEGWVEYEKMCALLWREGTSHGAYHEFEVKIVDNDHPITRGMGDFKLPDELYHNLIHMHGAEHHVLAAAYSSPDQGGSGNVEPMMLTTQYGRGRVYHSVLGHVWAGGPMTTFENKAFQNTLLRGSEWAATGDVE